MALDLPEGASPITPYLTMKDAVKMADFYERAFGFEKAEEIPGKDGKPMHVGMRYRGQSIVMFAPENAHSKMLSPATTKVPVPVSFYVYCDDVDGFVKKAVHEGARLISEPEDMFWGDRMAQMEDPEGYQWTFATKVGEFDASKMPKFE